MDTNETIWIFDPKNEPFGKLSNCAEFEIELRGDDEIRRAIWKSVSTYGYYKSVLSCFLDKRMDIKVADPCNLYAIFDHVYQKCINEIIKTSVRNAYRSKFFNDEDLMEKLLKTGTSPLVYNSNDLLLGIANGQGENYVGRVLENIRAEVFARIQEKKPYYIYVALLSLNEMLMKGKDIDKYTNMTYEQIITEAKQLNMAPKFDMNTILKMYSEESLEFQKIVNDEMNNPGNIVLRAKLDTYPQLILYQENVRQQQKLFIIPSVYVQSMSKQKYPDLDDEKVRKNSGRFLQNVSGTGFSEKIVELFDNKKLSNDVIVESERLVQETMEKKFHKILKKQDLRDLELISLKTIQAQEQKIIVFPSKDYDFLLPETRQEFKVAERLWPAEHEFHIEERIKELVFPTIFHYMYYKLYFRILGNIRSAYSSISGPNNEYKSLEQISTEFSSTQEKLYEEKLLKSTFYAMSAKFNTYPELKSLLLMTGNSELQYGDPNPILGGKRNEVGKRLKFLRKIFRREASVEKKLQATLDIVRDNKFLENWMYMRTGDLLSTIQSVKKYVDSMNEAGIFITPISFNREFVNSIIIGLYGPCVSLNTASLILTKAPHEFTNRIRLMNPEIFENLKDSGFQAIWEYISLLVFWISSNVKSSDEIESRIKEFQSYLADSTKNNTFETLANIIEFFFKFKKDHQVSESEVLVAGDILFANSENFIREVLGETMEVEDSRLAFMIKNRFGITDINSDAVRTINLIMKFADAHKNDQIVRNRINFFSKKIDKDVEHEKLKEEEKFFEYAELEEESEEGEKEILEKLKLPPGIIPIEKAEKWDAPEKEEEEEEDYEDYGEEEEKEEEDIDKDE